MPDWTWCSRGTPDVYTERCQGAAARCAQLRSSRNFALLVEQNAGKSSQRLATLR